MKAIGSFVVCVPYFGGLDPAHADAINVLRGRGVPILAVHGNPYIDHARATLAARAMKSQADVSMWIDHDILFEPHDVFETVEKLLSSPYDMLGACYPTKLPLGHVVGNPDLRNGDQRVEFYTDRLVDAAQLGMGFTAIRRTCFERVAFHHKLPKLVCTSTNVLCYPFFAHLFRDGLYLGEDYSFCRLVNEAGCRIGITLKPRLIHKGSYGYILEDTGACVEKVAPYPLTFVSDKAAAE